VKTEAFLDLREEIAGSVERFMNDGKGAKGVGGVNLIEAKKRKYVFLKERNANREQILRFGGDGFLFSL